MATTKIARACCPTCLRPFPAPSAKARIDPYALPEGHTTTATLSDDQLRQYYAAIAPMEDVKFHIRVTTPPDLQAEWIVLLGQIEHQNGKHTPTTKATYARLLQRGREQALAQHQRDEAAPAPVERLNYSPDAVKGRYTGYREPACKVFYRQGTETALLERTSLTASTFRYAGAEYGRAYGNCVIRALPANAQIATA